MLVRGLISLVLVILAGYGVYEVSPLIRGPVITLSTPSFTTSPDGILTVAGLASHTQSVMLDGAPLPIDEAGQFSRLIVLPSGGAILTVTASDRFGRSVSERIAVMVPY